MEGWIQRLRVSRMLPETGRHRRRDPWHTRQGSGGRPVRRLAPFLYNSASQHLTETDRPSCSTLFAYCSPLAFALPLAAESCRGRRSREHAVSRFEGWARGHRAAPRSGAQARGAHQGAHPQGLLRRPGVPPRHRRVHGADRRPAGHRHGRLGGQGAGGVFQAALRARHRRHGALARSQQRRLAVLHLLRARAVPQRPVHRVGPSRVQAWSSWTRSRKATTPPTARCANPDKIVRMQVAADVENSWSGAPERGRRSALPEIGRYMHRRDSAYLLDLATRVFGDVRTAAEWLDRPRLQLGGRAPRELFASGTAPAGSKSCCVRSTTGIGSIERERRNPRRGRGHPFGCAGFLRSSRAAHAAPGDRPARGRPETVRPRWGRESPCLISRLQSALGQKKAAGPIEGTAAPALSRSPIRARCPAPEEGALRRTGYARRSGAGGCSC